MANVVAYPSLLLYHASTADGSISGQQSVEGWAGQIDVQAVTIRRLALYALMILLSGRF